MSTEELRNFAEGVVYGLVFFVLTGCVCVFLSVLWKGRARRLEALQRIEKEQRAWSARRDGHIAHSGWPVGTPMCLPDEHGLLSKKIERPMFNPKLISWCEGCDTLRGVALMVWTDTGEYRCSICRAQQRLGEGIEATLFLVDEPRTWADFSKTDEAIEVVEKSAQHVESALDRLLGYKS